MLEIITGENIEKLRELAHKDSVNECVEWLIEHYHIVGEEVVKLQDENEELEQKNTDLKRGYDLLNKMHEEVCELNEKLKKDLSNVIDGNSAIQEKYNRTYKILVATGEHRDELKKENEEYNKENGRLVDDGMGLVKEIEELKARIAELEESEKQSIETMKIMGINCIGDLVKQNEELKETLRSIQAMDKEEPWEQVERLLSDAQDLATKNRKLEDELEKLKNSAVIYINSIVHLNYKIENMQSNIDFERGQKVQANKTIDKLLETLK